MGGEPGVGPEPITCNSTAGFARPLDALYASGFGLQHSTEQEAAGCPTAFPVGRGPRPRGPAASRTPPVRSTPLAIRATSRCACRRTGYNLGITIPTPSRTPPMKTLLTVLTAILLLAPAIAAAEPNPADSAPIQQGSGHPFACGDYSEGKVFLVSAEGKVEWEYPAPNCNDLWVLPNGNLLFVTGHGVKEVTARQEGRLLLRVEERDLRLPASGQRQHVHRRVQRGAAAGGRSAGQDRQGGPPAAGGQGRRPRLHAQRPAAGQRPLPGRPTTARRWSASTTPRARSWSEIPAPGGPHSAIRLPNGNTLIACGDTGQQARRSSRWTRTARPSGRSPATTCRASA